MSFKKDEMLIMPAVDIKNGKCVQLVQGKPGSEMVEIENPEEIALHWQDLGAKTIHIRRFQPHFPFLLSGFFLVFLL